MKPYPPLGILYLSAYLKRSGFSVEVFDSTFQDFEDFEQTLRTIRPRIVGLYTNIITRDNVLELTRRAKLSGVEFVLVGGPDAPEWAEVYFNGGVDIVGTNEGERTLEELIPHLQSHGLENLEQVEGIVFNKNGIPYRTPPRPAITDLDSLPWPDREVLRMEDYFQAWKSKHGRDGRLADHGPRLPLPLLLVFGRGVWPQPSPTLPQRRRRRDAHAPGAVQPRHHVDF